MVAALTMLADNSSVPYGEVDGKSTSSDTRDVVVVFVDGQLVFDTQTKHAPVVGANVSQRLSPGPHELEVRIVESKSDHENDGPLRKLVLNVVPCTRYHFEGKRVDSDWRIVAVGEAAIPDCRSHRK